MDVLDKPTQTRSDIHITLTPRCTSGNDVLHIEDLSKSFGEHLLFKHLSMDLKRGEHVAIIGEGNVLLSLEIMVPERPLF